MDSREPWQKYRICDIRSERDLLYQVGKTVGGVPITGAQFESAVSSIRDKLSLSEKDVLLDLCCGNGVLTKRLAPFVAHIHAVDFSEPYIANARQFCAAPNITYYASDVMQTQRLALGGAASPITKAQIYDALACFDRASLTRLLREMVEIYPELRQVLLGGVLFKPLRWRFFNTISRKLRYFFVMKPLGGNYDIGKWWSEAELRCAAREGGFPTLKITPQPPLLHTAHYCVDVLLQCR